MPELVRCSQPKCATVIVVDPDDPRRSKPPLTCMACRKRLRGSQDGSAAQKAKTRRAAERVSERQSV